MRKLSGYISTGPTVNRVCLSFLITNSGKVGKSAQRGARWARRKSGLITDENRPRPRAPRGTLRQLPHADDDTNPLATCPHCRERRNGRLQEQVVEGNRGPEIVISKIGEGKQKNKIR